MPDGGREFPDLAAGGFRLDSRIEVAGGDAVRHGSDLLDRPSDRPEQQVADDDESEGSDKAGDDRLLAHQVELQVAGCRIVAHEQHADDGPMVVDDGLVVGEQREVVDPVGAYDRLLSEQHGPHDLWQRLRAYDAVAIFVQLTVNFIITMI
jgi:hypothetical protein